MSSAKVTRKPTQANTRNYQAASRPPAFGWKPGTQMGSRAGTHYCPVCGRKPKACSC